MKPFFKSAILAISVAASISTPSYLVHEFTKDAEKIEVQDHVQKYSDTFVYESFEITELNNDDGKEWVRGEILSSTSGDMGGEGIVLDSQIFPDYNNYNFKVGDRIVVKYYEDDYNNQVWDNIADLQIIN